MKHLKPRTTKDYPLSFIIDEVVQETPTIRTFILSKPKNVLEIDEQRYKNFFDEMKCGRFLMVWLPEEKGGVDDSLALDSIPLGVSRVGKHRHSFSITVEKVGPTTSLLFRYGAGDAVGVMGPYGEPFSLPQTKGGGASRESVLIIAGGVGLAPLRYLYETLSHDNKIPHHHIHILYGARTREELMFKKDFESTFTSFSLYTDDGTLGIHGFPTDGLPSFLEQKRPRYIYICGPGPMLESIYKIIDKYITENDNTDDILAEYCLETRFYCGVGICGLCSHDKDREGRLVCKEGPVFSHEKLSFWKDA